MTNENNHWKYKSDLSIMKPSSSAAPSPHRQLNLHSITITFLLLSSVKYLLIPSYFSTDFDVHRNWLAITHHLPLNQWYFDDVDGGTVHTLDYPPLFAFFEWGLSNNFVTEKLLESGWLDERCLALLPDDDNEPSDRCIRFHRCTVILSDVMLFLGAYLASRAFSDVKKSNGRRQSNNGEVEWISFLLIVTNPGLIMLDNVHFQYNGVMLGILLCSIAFIIRGSQRIVQYSNDGMGITITSHQCWELAGAATFSALLAMKHLYLTLAPLYLFYLFGHHCFAWSRHKTTDGSTNVHTHFQWTRFLVLGVVTLVCFGGPFVPFLIQSGPKEQMQQMLKRLFPFGRGVSRSIVCISSKRLLLSTQLLTHLHSSIKACS